jgi:uncharacterized membrane protein
MTLPDAHEPTFQTARKSEFSTAEIGALAHLYRGEVYRSTVWRTRLDSSTNWAVVTTGIALSATYSSAQASPLPMVLVGLLVSVFLLFGDRLATRAGEPDRHGIGRSCPLLALSGHPKALT